MYRHWLHDALVVCLYKPVSWACCSLQEGVFPCRGNHSAAWSSAAGPEELEREERPSQCRTLFLCSDHGDKSFAIVSAFPQYYKTTSKENPSPWLGHSAWQKSNKHRHQLLIFLGRCLGLSSGLFSHQTCTLWLIYMYIHIYVSYCHYFCKYYFIISVHIYSSFSTFPWVVAFQSFPNLTHVSPYFPLGFGDSAAFCKL